MLSQVQCQQKLSQPQKQINQGTKYTLPIAQMQTPQSQEEFKNPQSIKQNIEISVSEPTQTIEESQEAYPQEKLSPLQTIEQKKQQPIEKQESKQIQKQHQQVQFLQKSELRQSHKQTKLSSTHNQGLISQPEVKIGPNQSQKLEGKNINTNAQFFDYQNRYIQRFGHPSIKIIYGETFQIQIKTKNLYITSVNKDDAYLLHEYVWGKPNAMKLFATGEIKTLDYTKKRVDGWVKRWREEIPFSDMTIRNSEKNFVGYIEMGFGSESNSSEIAYMICEEKWNCGFGYESVGALTLFLSKILAKNHFTVNEKKQDFRRIIATSNVLNIASQKILGKCGFQVYKESQKYGSNRYEYELWVN